MVRSQIQFAREQLESIRSIARSEGVSIAEVVRRAVDHYAEHRVPAAREEALHAMLATGRKRLSLTDCVSFEVMRRNGCARAFAFDPHFDEQGFVTR